MVAGKHRIGIHSAEVLHLKLNQRLGKVRRVPKLLRESVGLELVLAAEDVHAQLDQHVHRGQHIREQDESDDDGPHCGESEVRVQRLVVNEDREQGEDVEEVELRQLADGQSKHQVQVPAYLRNAKQSGSVAQTPVAQFMGQDSGDLLRFALLNQGVIDNDVLLPGHAKEVSIAVCASLAAVDDEQLSQRELKLGRESFDLSLQVTGFQRSKFIEQGRDDNGPDGDHEDLETSTEQPEVVEELLASLLDNREEGSQNRRGQGHSQAHRLDLVRDIQLGGLLVETELLLQHKGVVYRGRGRNDLVDYRKGQDKDNGLGDFTSKASGGELEQ